MRKKLWFINKEQVTYHFFGGAFGGPPDPQLEEGHERLRFSHGGPEYDAKYPDGIPTAIDITLKSGKANLGEGEGC